MYLLFVCLSVYLCVCVSVCVCMSVCVSVCVLFVLCVYYNNYSFVIVAQHQIRFIVFVVSQLISY